MQDTNLVGFALSPLQRRVISFLDPLKTGEPYLAQVSVAIEGPLDYARLQLALVSVIRRHEILRTRFVRRPGLTALMQVILGEQTLSAELFNLSFGGSDGDLDDDDIAPCPVPSGVFETVAGPLVHVMISQRTAVSSLLTLTIPVICGDAASMKTIVDDLAESYTTPSSPLAQAVQYADVAEYFNDTLASEAGALGRQYWRPLTVASRTVNLRQVPGLAAQTGFLPSVLRTHIPASANAASWGSGYPSPTADLFLLTCWHLLLSRIGGRKSLSVGYAANGRVASELEGCVGLFETYLPIELVSLPDMTFLETLLATTATVEESAKWQDAFQWPDERGFNFAAFSYYDGDWCVQAEDVRFRCAGIRVCSDRYCIKLSCVKQLGGTGIELWYDPIVYTEPEIQRLLSQFVTLVESAGRSPDLAIKNLDIISESERRQLVYDFNVSEGSFPSTSLESRFAEQVEQTPDAVAILCGNLQVSYGKLNERASRLAQHLRALGVGSETRVALCLRREAAAVVSVLAVLKAGAAYVPIDPTYPPERLAYMLEDAKSAVVLTSLALAEQFSAIATKVVCVDGQWERSAYEDAQYPIINALPENPAYILYTSGSTGRPKGVVVTRGGLMNYVNWACDAYEFAKGMRTPLHSSMSFDLTVTSLWPPLLTGGCVVVIPEDHGIEALISDDEPHYEYGMIKITPSHLRVLENASELKGEPGLTRRFVIGGEALTWEALEYWRRQAPSIHLINEYGPTETVVGCCVYEAAGGVGDAGPVPIGRPIANTQAYVLDERGELTPAGAAAELCIGGAGVARGYWNRPGLTAERFVPDGISGNQGARVYRTGDQVSWRADRQLEFHGRLDDQVKMRGYRIELGEIKSVLGQHRGVRLCAVCIREDRPGDKRLVAYVVRAGEELPTSAELQGYLRDKLPEYMIPSAFVELSELPLTPNGKIDGKSLPAPADVSATADLYVAPRTAVEHLLTAIWGQVLRVERLGIHDNFFTLGGDSILSVQVISRAKKAGLLLTPRQLFEHQTIAELAAVTGTCEAVEVEQRIISGDVALTPIQRWFFERDLLKPDHFNQAVLLGVPADFNFEWFEQALNHLINHHDTLRLRFERRDGGWRQFNAAVEVHKVCGRIDLSHVAAGDRAAAIEAEATRAQTSLDLIKGPLQRVIYFNLGEGEQGRLFWAIHHLAVDVVSWRILLEDLETAYHQLGRNEQVRLAAKTTSYREWAERLLEYGGRAEVLAEVDYWNEQGMRGGGRLPVDFAAGENSEASSRQVEVALSEAETRTLLQEVPRVYRTQINDLLLTALGQTLCEWSGTKAVMVDLEGHGREREEEIGGVDVSRTVGWFTTIYPVRLEVANGKGDGEALKRVKEQMRAMPRGGLGYGVLKYLSTGPEVRAKLEETSEAEVLFNYLGQLDQVVAQSGLWGMALEGSGQGQGNSGMRSYLLEINGVIAGSQLRLSWTYSEAKHRRERIESMAADYVQRLRRLISHCQSAEAGGYTPSDFPMARLTQPQVDQLVRPGERVDDIYGLSPMQQGLLFHALYETGSTLAAVQMVFRLNGDLNVSALERSWNAVIRRHEVLRATYHWEGLAEPVQVVHEGVEMVFEQRDWRGQEHAEDGELLEDYLQADRRRGFDIARAPLMRVVVMRSGSEIYEMVWSWHHLLMDGWSFPVLLKEVLGFYRAYSAGRELRLEPSKAYRSYISWLQQQDLREPENYWRGRLKGFRNPTHLEVERRVASEPATDYAAQDMQLSEVATERLQEYARKEQLTLNTVAQGGWAVLLGRYSGEIEVVYGVTVSGRPAELAGVEEMVGLFINTLPVRVEMGGELQVGEWLRDLQKQQAEMRRYEYSPLVEVQGWSEVERGQALFESIVVFQNFPLESVFENDTADGLPAVRGEQGSRIDVSHVSLRDAANYPLTVNIGPGRRLGIRILYDANKFEATTIRKLIMHYGQLLESLVGEPAQRITDVEMLSEPERQQLLVEWNVTRREYRSALCLHELFESQAGRTPEALAVRCEDQHVSYSELNGRANQLSHYLRGLGVGPEVVVALLVERSLDMVEAVLGILKAGGAYLPLDAQSPIARLAVMLEETQAPVLLTHEGRLDGLPAYWGQLVCLDRERESIASESRENPVPEAGSANLAYIIYTSGSSGVPKGVMVTHGGVVNYLRWCSEVYRLAEGRGSLVHSALSFDLTVTSVFGPLVSGTAIEIVREEEGIEGLLRHIRKGADYSLVKLTPAHLKLLEGMAEQVEGWSRELIIGGEALDWDRLRYWQKRAPQTRLINEYGPTETVVGSSMYEVTGLEEQEGAVPIGRPIANTQMYMLDERFEPAAAGVIGELYIGGIGVGRGYQQRADMTAERFVPDPHGERQGNRMYRTGDIGRYLPSGEMEYLGRMDNQVKVRGFRIELGEVEAALTGHQEVKEAVVLARGDVSGEKRLVAYVVAMEGTILGIGRVPGYLKERLPEYMVPAEYVVLDKLPLTANGKVDRRALPDPEITALDSTYEKPADEFEEKVVRIWEELLRIESIGVKDNFWALGGHSLLAMQAVSRMRSELGVSVTLQRLFDEPTVRGMSAAIRGQNGVGAGLERNEVERVIRKGDLPLSFAQQRLWFIEQLDPGNPAYNIVAAQRIRGELGLQTLEDTLSELIRRHEVLRTTFDLRNDQPVQIISAEEKIRFLLTDLSSLPTTQQAHEAARLANEEAKCPFDLTCGPLLRVRIFRMGEEEHIVTMTMHHIVCDGWSAGLLLRETQSLYSAFSSGLPSPLSELRIQYADFAIWQREWLQGDVLDALLVYWRRQLGASPPVLELPIDRLRSSVQSPECRWQPFSLSPTLSEALRRLSLQEGVTLFMMLLAAFQTLLHRKTNQDDIIVGTDIANRNRRDTVQLIGFFVNILVLRSDLSGNPRFRELLRRVRLVALGAYDHQDMPYEKIVEEINPERSQSHKPLVQVSLVWQDNPATLEISGVVCEPLPISTGIVSDLSLIINETDEGLDGIWCYDASLFEDATISRFSGHFKTLLESIVADPDTRLSELEMLTEVEREQIAIKENERHESNRKRLKSIKPKAVSLPPGDLIRVDYFKEGQALPLVIRPAANNLNLISWARANRAFIEQQLLKHGALLFRDFDIGSVVRFEEFLMAMSSELLEYSYRSTPRRNVRGKIYTSTEYPADQTIVLHNEMAYAHNWPMKIAFFSIKTALRGGETPIADSRAVFNRISPKVRERFAQRQVMYVRNYDDNFDLAWQNVFQTTNKLEVERYCREAGITFEWKGNNGLRTREVRQAVAIHPKTGEPVWFNQAHLFHISNLSSEVRQSLMSGGGQEDVPRNAYYGDGTPIQTSVLDEIREIYRQEAVSFPWQEGDVLMLDNMLTAHGRMPFEGERRVVVGMAEDFNNSTACRTSHPAAS